MSITCRIKIYKISTKTATRTPFSYIKTFHKVSSRCVAITTTNQLVRRRSLTVVTKLNFFIFTNSENKSCEDEGFWLSWLSFFDYYYYFTRLCWAGFYVFYATQQLSQVESSLNKSILYLFLSHLLSPFLLWQIHHLKPISSF